jgi:tetratricopeptide (TPR) repeat protein
LLQLAEQISRYPEVFSRDRFAILQTYAEIRIASYFLTNRGSDEMFDLVQKIAQEAKNACAELDFTDGNNGNTRDVATALYLLGQAHYYYTLNTGGSDYGNVFNYCYQSLDIWEKLEKERQIAMASWDNLTSEDSEADEYARNDVLRLLERGMSQALFCLGLAHERLQEKEQARDSYQRALDLALRSDAKEEASYAYRHLAGLTEDKEQQLEYALQSLQLREEIGFKRTLPYSHLLVCDMYLQRHDLEKAQEYCQSAFQLAEAMEMKNALMMVYYSQGEIYQCKDRLDEARQCFVQCLDFATQLGTAYGIAEATKKLQELG